MAWQPRRPHGLVAMRSFVLLAFLAAAFAIQACDFSLYPNDDEDACVADEGEWVDGECKYPQDNYQAEEEQWCEESNGTWNEAGGYCEYPAPDAGCSCTGDSGADAGAAPADAAASD